MTKAEFVSRVMSDMAKKRRDKIRTCKAKVDDYVGAVMDTPYKILRRIR